MGRIYTNWRLTNKTNNVRYNGNNKEIKEAILKENQPYLYSELNRLTKLELLNIIQSRDERAADERDGNMFHGIATITVILNDIKKHELKYDDESGQIDVKKVFALADKLEDLYIDYYHINTEIKFISNYGM